MARRGDDRIAKNGVKRMKITKITVFQVDLPLEHPYWL